jgi:hypothetical protein
MCTIFAERQAPFPAGTVVMWGTEGRTWSADGLWPSPCWYPTSCQYTILFYLFSFLLAPLFKEEGELFHSYHPGIGVIVFAGKFVSQKLLTELDWNFTHIFESIEGGPCPKPLIVMWFMTKLWPLWQNYGPFTISKLLFYCQALRKVEHGDLPTATSYV